MADEFAKIGGTRANSAFYGAVMAGDGLVVRIKAPSAHEVGGNVISYYQRYNKSRSTLTSCRKGYYAYGLQAFCDANLRFRNVSMKCCASTHDSTAYEQSAMARFINNKRLPDEFFVVLDEAYTCRQQELSPWKGKALPEEKDVFNYYLSLHRQVTVYCVAPRVHGED